MAIIGTCTDSFFFSNIVALHGAELRGTLMLTGTQRLNRDFDRLGIICSFLICYHRSCFICILQYVVTVIVSEQVLVDLFMDHDVAFFL